MGYVGNKPALNYTTFAVQHFTTSATTGYTLDNAVTNENDIRLVINNVVQQPGGSYAYTASGTTLTLSAATTSSDTMYCVFLGKAVQTVNPGAGSVGTSQLATDAVTQVKMADDSVGTAEILDTNVTGAKLNDDVISGQGALGAAPADTDEFLVSDAGVLKRVDYSYIKGITQTSFLPTAEPLIINGDMAVSQRATSTASHSGSGFGACDRWEHDSVGGGVWTVSQETLTSGNAYEDGFSNAYKMDCTTADASPSASNILGIRYQMEGRDVQLLKKGTSNAEKVTVAFWVKATKTGNNVCNLYDSDNARVCSLSYTISSTNTWEHKVLNFPADTTGVLTNDNGNSFRLYFFQQSGTTYNSGTQPTTWEAYTNADWCVGQVNHADSTSNNFHVTGVQMEVGEYTSSDLPPFRHETYGTNLTRCQRYFQTIADGAWSSNETIAVGYFHVSSSFFFGVRLVTVMRANPSLTKTMGTDYVRILRDDGADTGDNIETYDGVTKRALGLKADDNTSGTQGQGGQIGLNNASAFFGVDAEL